MPISTAKVHFQFHEMRVEEKSLACRKDRENEAIDGKYYTPKKKEFVYSDTEETK